MGKKNTIPPKQQQQQQQQKINQIRRHGFLEQLSESKLATKIDGLPTCSLKCTLNLARFSF